MKTKQNEQNKFWYSLPRPAKYVSGWEGECIVHLFFVDEHGQAMVITESASGVIRVIPATWIEMSV